MVRVRSPSTEASGVSCPVSALDREEYRVRKGDTFAEIADRYGVRLDVLVRANPTLPPRELQPGDMVTIPREQPQLRAEDYPLDATAGRRFTLDELRPAMEAAAEMYGVPVELLIGVAGQESSFINFATHRDGHGTGLFGLDPRGELPSFVRWAGPERRDEAQQRPPPPLLQIEYLALRLSELRAPVALSAPLGTEAPASVWDDPGWTRALSRWHHNVDHHPEYLRLVREKYDTWSRGAPDTEPPLNPVIARRDTVGGPLLRGLRAPK